jgi:2-oxoglutarate dehydrogenase E1 component
MFRAVSRSSLARRLVSSQTVGLQTRPPTSLSHLPSTLRRMGTSQKDTDSFLSGSNAIYAEEMYRAWLKDPESVHASWAAYFKGLAAGGHPGGIFSPAPAPGSPPFTPETLSTAAPSLMTRVTHLVRAYQVRGHERAKLDPLGLWDPVRFGGACPLPHIVLLERMCSLCPCVCLRFLCARPVTSC